MPLDTKALMRQARRIRVMTSRHVNTTLSGEYHSAFKGRGIEFDEVRPYVTGDDIRTIDWNVTARTGHPYVKRFVEERELTVLFLVDISGSQCFGSGTRSKADAAAEITCLLALSAIRNQDKIGLLLFSDRIEAWLPPRKGRTAVMRLVREVLAAEQTRHGTDIAGALRFLNAVQKRRATVFLISDFMDRDYLKALRTTARRHDLIGCPVSDPAERALARAGMLDVQDPESGQLAVLDTASRRVRRRYRAAASAEREALRADLKRLRIDTLFLSTDRPFVDDIRKLFRARQRRAARHC